MEDLREKERINFVPAKKISGNSCFTIAVNDHDEIFSWGSNKDDRLGHKDKANSTLIQYPCKYDFFSNKFLGIIDADCGSDHIIVTAASKESNLNDGGNVYTWGLPLYGRLGYTDNINENITIDNIVYRPINKPLNIQEKVVRVACGYDFSACITVSGKLYTWGTNKYGNLGVENKGSDTNHQIISKPELVTSLTNINVIQVVCGRNHMMCLSSEGNVFSWGHGENGVLGHGNFAGINKPQIIKDLRKENICFIAAGEANSAAISIKGSLYIWGQGQHGRIGIGSLENQNTPQKVIDNGLEKEKVSCVSLGFYHTICCTLDAKTYAWGSSEKGKLGCIDKSDCDAKKIITTPRLIPDLNGIQITQLYAGPFYSYAIQGILGKLWGWGENIDYILGNNDEGEDGKKKDGGTGGIMGIFKRNVDRIINKDSSSSYKKTTYYKPIELRANKELVKISGELQDFSKQLISNINNNPILEISIKSKIKKIACGGNHSLMLTLTGEMFSWGFGEVGQLGLGKDKKVAIKPIRINLEGDRLVSKIYAGYANSMCIIQKTNEVLIWGDGSKGQLCSDKKSSDIPIVIDDLNGRGIYKGTLGYNNAACITKDGKLYVWGSNDTHKLGIDSHNDYEAIPRMIESLSGVVKVSLGFQHSAAILMNEDLYTWGHNFYGQLGLGDTLTRDEPKKVEFNDLKFTKVKCSYSHTLALEKKGLVYVWGKGGVNLSELGKNKNSPDIIEEMKQYKIASIKVGENFSFLLTNNGTLFGFGDNSYYQISATDPIDKPIIRNPKELKLVSNNNNIAIKIIKIFIGYDHCFCITDSGETFAWGNCSSHRLTEDYGTIQLKIPKEVILFKQNNLTTNKKDKLEIGHTSNYSENKQIIDFIKNNYQKEHFQSMKNIFWVLDSLDSKYDDVKLIENDWNLNNVLYEGLNKLSENLPVIDTNQIMHYQKLLRFRFRSIGIFKNYNSQDLRPDIIINNMDEIENIFTLLYLHPCFISAYFESGIAENYFYHFFGGLRCLFPDLNTYSKKSENYDNIIYLTYFKLFCYYDIEVEETFENLFIESSYYCLTLLDGFFHNLFKKNIYFELVPKALLELFKVASLNPNKYFSKDKAKKDKGIDEFLLISEFIILMLSGGKPKVQVDFKKQYLIDIITIGNLFINELVANINKIPHYVAYCFTYFKATIINKFKNETVEAVDEKLFYIFVKRYVSGMIKELIGKNSEFLKQFLNYNTNLEALTKKYLVILAQLVDLLCLDKEFNFNLAFINDISDDIISDMTNQINSTIKNLRTILKNQFVLVFLNSKYELDNNCLSSMIYSHLKVKTKKIKIELGVLISFLKAIFIFSSSKEEAHCLNFSNYSIFSLFEKNGNIKNQYKDVNKNQIIQIVIDTRYLLKPKLFLEKYKNEIKFSNLEKDTYMNRCKKCNISIPAGFILNIEDRDEFLIKSISSKLEYDYLKYISDAFRDKFFERESVKTNIESLIYALQKLSQTSRTGDQKINNIQKIIRYLEEEDAKQEGLTNVLKSISNHIYLKITHYEYISNIIKIKNDLTNAKEAYIKKLSGIKSDIKSAIKQLSIMSNSLEFIDDDNNKIDLLKNQLSHYQKFQKLNDKHSEDIIKMKLFEDNFYDLFVNKTIMVGSPELNKLMVDDTNREYVIQITSNISKGCFEIKLLSKKTKE